MRVLPRTLSLLLIVVMILILGRADDRSALMSLYDATNGQEWTKNTNWGSTDAVCLWYGVCCNMSGNAIENIISNPDRDSCLPDYDTVNFNGSCCQPSGIVTGLLLTSNNLRGSIPSSLSELHMLELLDLSNNDLYGGIPENLYNVVGMLGIVLNHNPRLGGTLSPSISKMQNIQGLFAEACGLGGTFPPGLTDLQKLTSLHLHLNRFTGTLPLTLPNMTSLVNLYLYGNGFSGTLPPLPRDVENLVLSDNNFEGTIPTDWFASTVSNGRLQYMDLGGNSLTGTIPLCFEGLEELTFLALPSNYLTGGLGNIPKFVSTLILRYNELHGDLGDQLTDLSAPTLIDVSNNPNLGGPFPKDIVSNPYLQYFFANNCTFQNGSIDDVSSDITAPKAIEMNLGLPQHLYFLPDLGNSFPRYDCSGVVSHVNPRLSLHIDPSYYGYSSCSCDIGFEGRGPDCIPCKAGYFKADQMSSIVCKKCPAGTYAPEPGSFACLSCNEIFSFVYNDGAACFSGIFAVIALFGVLLLVVIAIAVVLVTLGVVFGGAVVKKVTERIAKFRFEQLTKLVNQRARNEIPADLLIKYDELNLKSLIGRGAFAKVYRAVWRRNTVAVKELQLDAIELGFSVSAGANTRVLESDSFKDFVEDFHAEVKIMSQLHHPNIILLVGACTAYPNLCLVTEILAASLYDRLHDEKVKIDFSVQSRWICEIAGGMEYLHSRNIMHRDLKSHNVLLTYFDEVCKLCDFGLAREHAVDLYMTSGIGSIPWMAPELLRNENYSYPADVYSFGVVVWEIMSPREELYPRRSPMEIMTKVVSGELRPAVSELWPVFVVRIATSCWDADPAQRPTFTEITDSMDKYTGHSQKQNDRRAGTVSSDTEGGNLMQPLLST
jgi:hypothetical protein